MTDPLRDVLAAALATFPVPETLEEYQAAVDRSYESDADAIVAALAQQGVTLTREPLDVARLAVAIRKVERENDLRSDTDLGVKPMEGPPPHWYEGYAAEVAREYAALASEDRP